MTPARASELQGLLKFAVSFYVGKSLKHVISAVAPFADHHKHAHWGSLQELCRYAKDMLIQQQPRQHSLKCNKHPVAVFTDGAWEDGAASAGAVVLDGDTRLAFNIVVPQEHGSNAPETR